MRFYCNEDDGLESRIIDRADGYLVELWDMDAGPALLGARVYRNERRAVRAAIVWAGLEYKVGSIVNTTA